MSAASEHKTGAIADAVSDPAFVDRFWAKVVSLDSIEGACWSWGGAKIRGYGQVSLPGGQHLVGAHRVSWVLHNGPIPHGSLVLHRCDNPECTRPSHLFLGTPRDNTQDMIRKGRNADVLRGSLSHLSKLTEEDVATIRLRCSSGERQRDVARDYGVTPPTISNIIRGATWKHVKK